MTTHALAAPTNLRPLDHLLAAAFAVPLIVFGLNKFLGFADVPPPEGETAQLFLGAMFSSYLAPFVGAIEIVGGVLFLVPRTSFVGLLVLTPIVANIAAFHVAHDLPGNMIWLGTLALFGAAAYRHRGRLKGLIEPQS